MPRQVTAAAVVMGAVVMGATMCGCLDGEIAVLTPRGGEQWMAGSHKDITWLAIGVEEVRIEFSADGGATWETVAAGLDSARSSWSWKVADPGVLSENCLIRVSDAADGTPADSCAGAFTVTPRQVDFSPLDEALAQIEHGSVAWGDYDSDGDLDLALAGLADVFRQPVTKIYRNDDGAFTELGAGLPGVGHSSLAWGDFDGDGDLDLALAGTTDGSPGGAVSRIYRNDGTFVDLDAGLPGVAWCALSWADFDNDGDFDLALAGWGAFGPVTELYRNTQGVFVKKETGADLVGVYKCSLAWADYDNDGDLDLALAGEDNEDACVGKVYRNDGDAFRDALAAIAPVKSCAVEWVDFDSDGRMDLSLAGYSDAAGLVTRLYRNAGGGAFVDLGAGLVRVEQCALRWGDCDSDGDPDLVVAGRTGTGYVTEVYRNEGAGSLAPFGAGIAQVARCSVAWGDCNGDGKLDLAVAGREDDLQGDPMTEVYLNGAAVQNTAPSAPDGLLAELGSGSVVFSWNPATDLETPSPGLTYNVRIGTASGKDDVMPGMSITDPGGEMDGRRLVPAMGNVQHGTSWTLSLDPGTYHWSVQAVDTSFEGSTWAEEKTVVVE